MAVVSVPKPSIKAAWRAWTTNRADGSGDDFLRRALPWMEGTAAQLLRMHWPTGVRRPTSAEIQLRLRHHLTLAAGHQYVDHLAGLECARSAVIEELRQERTSDADENLPSARLEGRTV
jgi:hypothetical protein